MWTRIFEGVMIAAIGTGLTLFVGLPMAVERIQAKVDANAAEFSTHIQWAQAQVASRNAEMAGERKLMFDHDSEILQQIKQANARLDTLYNCVSTRACTK